MTIFGECGINISNLTSARCYGPLIFSRDKIGATMVSSLVVLLIYGVILFTIIYLLSKKKQ
jgi:hypothetical protein